MTIDKIMNKNISDLSKIMNVDTNSLSKFMGHGVSSGSAWLGSWDKRIEITLDKDQIDVSLFNFPIMVYLSASSGPNNNDVSAIFDELTSDANRKKIAVTDSDGTTQCYVEIERWDDGNEKAWLHVKVPSASSTVDGKLFIYYDSSQADNTTYVGDVGSTPGQAVWDNNFKAVYHLGEDPYGGSECVKDSTSWGNNGTPGGFMNSADFVDGKIGKGIDFDGINDFVNFGSDASLDDITIKTLEIVTYLRARSPIHNDLGSHWLNKGNVWFLSTDQQNTRNIFGHSFSGNSGRWSFPEFTLNAWHHLAVRYDKSSIHNNPSVYVDATSQTITEYYTPTGTASSDASFDLLTSKSEGNDRTIDGVLDEIRISNTTRPESWVKATYQSLWDNLLTFGSEEVS